MRSQFIRLLLSKNFMKHCFYETLILSLRRIKIIEERGMKYEKMSGDNFIEEILIKKTTRDEFDFDIIRKWNVLRFN